MPKKFEIVAGGPEAPTQPTTVVGLFVVQEGTHHFLLLPTEMGNPAKVLGEGFLSVRMKEAMEGREAETPEQAFQRLAGRVLVPRFQPMLNPGRINLSDGRVAFMSHLPMQGLIMPTLKVAKGEERQAYLMPVNIRYLQQPLDTVPALAKLFDLLCEVGDFHSIVTTLPRLKELGKAPAEVPATGTAG